jgi:hypothetical protein
MKECINGQYTPLLVYCYVTGFTSLADVVCTSVQLTLPAINLTVFAVFYLTCLFTGIMQGCTHCVHTVCMCTVCDDCICRVTKCILIL